MISIPVEDDPRPFFGSVKSTLRFSDSYPVKNTEAWIQLDNSSMSTITAKPGADQIAVNFIFLSRSL